MRELYTHILFDVGEISRFPESFDIPVQILKPLVNNRVVATNRSKVALEMLHIDHIKADDCGICSDVKFGETFSKYVWATISKDDALQLIERSEYCRYVFVIGFLICSETGLVNT